MKTIKVIELLNKIHCEKKVPEKIKYEGRIWSYKNWLNDYMNNDNTDFLFEVIFKWRSNATGYELEIIEDDEQEETDKKEEFHLYTQEELDNMTTKELEEVLIEQLKILGEQLSESIFKRD